MNRGMCPEAWVLSVRFIGKALLGFAGTVLAPISKKEIEGIFAFFRSGKTEPKSSPREDYALKLRAASQGNTAQAFAEVLRTAVSKRPYCDRRESKIVKHAAEALAHEIAIVQRSPFRKRFH